MIQSVGSIWETESCLGSFVLKIVLDRCHEALRVESQNISAFPMFKMMFCVISELIYYCSRRNIYINMFLLINSSNISIYNTVNISLRILNKCTKY